MLSKNLLSCHWAACIAIGAILTPFECAQAMNEETKADASDLPMSYSDFADIAWQRGNVPVLSDDREIFIGVVRGITRSQGSDTTFKLLRLSHEYVFEAVNDIAFMQFDGRSMVFVGTKRGLFVSCDGGENFSLLTSEEGLPAQEISRVMLKVFDARLMVLVSSSTDVFVSKDGGLTFCKSNWPRDKVFPIHDLTSIAYNGKLMILAAGLGGLFSSSDEGENFHKVWKDKQIQ